MYIVIDWLIDIDRQTDRQTDRLTDWLIDEINKIQYKHVLALAQVPNSEFYGLV